MQLYQLTKMVQLKKLVVKRNLDNRMLQDVLNNQGLEDEWSIHIIGTKHNFSLFCPADFLNTGN